MSRPCRLWSFFFCALVFRGSVGFFCRGILRLSTVIFNSPFEYDMMLFKRSFGLTSSLFILYVLGHDLLGFGMQGRSQKKLMTEAMSMEDL